MHRFSGIVKRQLDYWRYQVTHYGPDHPRYRPAKIAKYEHLIREFSELSDYLDSLPDQVPVHNQPQATPAPYRQPRTRLGRIGFEEVPQSPQAASPADLPDDLADLPPELLDELSDSIKGETDPLIKIINARGGTATLDEILIDLWRKYKEVGKRPIISNKLYRLSKRGLCWAVPGKKGIYSTTRPTSGNETPPADDDDAPDAGHKEPTSAKPETAQSAAPAPKSSKIRRELFASTAVPSFVAPRH